MVIAHTRVGLNPHGNVFCQKLFHYFSLKTFVNARPLLINALSSYNAGPLAISRGTTTVLLGLLSFGASCTRNRSPEVYTRVGAFIDWLNQIEDITAINDGCEFDLV